MNKQDRVREQILQHGFTLKTIFNVTDTSPVTLFKAVHRIETEAHSFAEKMCNEDVPEIVYEKKTISILERLNNLLHFRESGIPVFVNGDPRGYALKIEDDYVKELANKDIYIYRDWGGYGILAPDFN